MLLLSNDDVHFLEMLLVLDALETVYEDLHQTTAQQFSQGSAAGLGVRL